MSKVFLILGFSFGLIANSGCTRPDAKSVSLSLTMPSDFSSVSSVSGHSHISLYVSGTGVDALCVYEYDAGSGHTMTSGPCAFDSAVGGTSIAMDLPTAVSLTFQAVYSLEGATTGSKLLYGETPAAVTFTKASDSVAITMGSFASNSTAQGEFVGRYGHGSSGSPTYDSGTLTMIYHPPSGSKPMPVMRSEVYSGWFKVHSLDASISYEINGTPLFTDIVAGGILKYSDFIATTGTTLSTGSSQFSTTYDTSGNGSSQTFGWFGPGTSSSNITKTDFTSCYGSLEFSSCLVNGNSGNNRFSSQFRGPFRSTSGTFISVINSASTILSATLLPGVTVGTNSTDILSDIKVIVLPGISSAAQLAPYVAGNDNNWSCDQLVTAGSMVTSGTSIMASVQTSIQYIASLASTDVVFFCPVVNGVLMTGAVVYPEKYNNMNNGNGGGSNMPYLYPNTPYPGSGTFPGNTVGTYFIGANTCVSFAVGSYTSPSTGQATPYPAPATGVSATVGFSPSGGSFYSGSACTGVASTTGSFNIISGGSMSSGMIYFMYPSATTGSFNYSIGLGSGSYSTTSQWPSVIVSPPPVMSLNFSPSVLGNSCVPLVVNVNTPPASTYTLNVSDLTPNSGTFYSESTCASPLGISLSGLIYAPQSSSILWYKNGLSTASYSILANIPGANSASVAPIVVTGCSVLTKLALVGPSNIAANNCVAYAVVQTDGTSACSSGSRTVNLSTNVINGAFYSNADGTCTGSPIASMYLAPDGNGVGTGVGFYFKSGSANQTGVSITATESTSLIGVGTMAIIVAP